MKTLYKTVIVGIDDNERAQIVLNKAIKVAKVAHANIIIVSAIPYNAIVSFNYAGMDPLTLTQYVLPQSDEVEVLINERKNFIDQILTTVDTQGIKEIKKVIEIDDPETKIIELAEKNSDSIIVIGASDKNTIERFILGSVARQILNASPVDVLLARK